MSLRARPSGARRPERGCRCPAGDSMVLTIARVLVVPWRSSTRVPDPQRPLGEVGDGRRELGDRRRGVGGGGDQVAAGDVESSASSRVTESPGPGERLARRQRCRCRRPCVPDAGRQHDDRVADADRAGGDPARVAAVVRVLRRSAAGSRTGPGSATSRRRCRWSSMSSCSRCSSTLGPPYQSMCADLVTTLSPCSAEIGIDGHLRDAEIRLRRRRTPRRWRRKTCSS